MFEAGSKHFGVAAFACCVADNFVASWLCTRFNFVISNRGLAPIRLGAWQGMLLGSAFLTGESVHVVAVIRSD